MDTIFTIMFEIKKKYKSGNAAEIISEAILAGDISGEIGQNEFADSLEVSRIPVREALITLEYHGLIEKMTNQHVRVIDLEDEDIKNIFADMSLLELEAIKTLPERIVQELSSSGQTEFHREIYCHTSSPLRRVFLRVIAETYITFITRHSEGRKIESAFDDVRRSLRNTDALKAAYAVYAEVLADELMSIRRNKAAIIEEESSC